MASVRAGIAWSFGMEPCPGYVHSMSQLEQCDLVAVAGIVDNEGLGYAIQHYLDPARIADPVLREKWAAAAKILNDIDEILDPARDACA
jgi:hypothetical protein